VNGGAQPVEVETPAGAPVLDLPNLEEPSRDDTVDGRTARSAKTRDAIADAMLDLLAEGELRPTAKAIAGRASVSVRSVYVHFDDLEDLFCVAAKQHFARIAPMLTPAPATGPLADRARALAAQRGGIYAKTGAVGLATRLHAQSSPTLARILRDARARSRTDLERVFAHELHELDGSRRASTVSVLDVLTAPDAWSTLRDHHDLDLGAAIRCVADAIVVQLQGTGR
jgi:TetR/AcrR family transcriptional regulator of autoinduction and epiphytic fitness